MEGALNQLLSCMHDIWYKKLFALPFLLPHSPSLLILQIHCQLERQSRKKTAKSQPTNCIIHHLMNNTMQLIGTAPLLCHKHVCMCLETCTHSRSPLFTYNLYIYAVADRLSAARTLGIYVCGSGCMAIYIYRADPI